MTCPRIAILVLGYNHRGTLEETLASALRQDYHSFELFYIDNGSTDGSLEFVREKFPSLTHILHPKNLGYAGAYRLALERVFQEGFHGAFLLNPDVSLADDCLRHLVASAYANPAIALAQPKVYLWDAKTGPTNIFNTCGNQVHFLGFGYCGCYGLKDEPPLVQDRAIPYASGAGLLVKMAAYRRLPGLDADFFAYLEDQDLGWQARLFGYEIILSGAARMWHKYDFQKNNSNHEKYYLLERNRLVFLIKHYQIRTLLLFSLAFLFMEAGVLTHALVHGYVQEKLRGYLYFFRHRKRIFQTRRRMQKERIRSDAEISIFFNARISFSQIDSFFMRIANGFLAYYYAVAKKFL